MKQPSLNESVRKALVRLTELKRINANTKWSFENTRDVMWSVIVQQILPEYGIKAGKKGSDGKPDAEQLEQDNAAFLAFRKAFDAGYTLESSNLGRHAAAHGFCRKSDNEAARPEDAEVFV